MSFLFPQKRPKTLNEVVYALSEWIARVGDSGQAAVNQKGPPASSTPPEIHLNDQQRQAAEECGKLLAQIRKSTWAQAVDSSGQPDPEQLTLLAKEVYSTDVLVPLVQNLRLLEFDAKRDVANFFCYILKRLPTVDYLLYKVPEVFTILLSSAGAGDIHRTVCQILRECARHEALVAYVLNLQNFWWFFQYMDDAEFEVATDNFTTFTAFMSNYPSLASDFLKRNREYFTQCINGLIRSNNYVAKRQSLRLLYSLLKQRRNQEYLFYYCDGLENLKLIMLLLKDKSKNIHYEAFQIFKCFVANPNKSQPILNILIRNKVKLLGTLDQSSVLERRDDPSYQKEYGYVRERILALPDLQVKPSLQHQGARPMVEEERATGQNSDKLAPGLAPQQAYVSDQQLVPPLHVPRSGQNITAPNQASEPLSPLDQQRPHYDQSAHSSGNQPLNPLNPLNTSHQHYRMRPRSPSRAQVPPAVLDARPASPVLSRSPFHPS